MIRKYLVLLAAVAAGIGTSAINAQEQKDEAQPARSQIQISGSDAPSYVAAAQFFRLAGHLEKGAISWPHPTPSPWQVHILDPLGIEKGSKLEIILKDSLAGADEVLGNAFVAGILKDPSSEGFEASQAEAANLRSRRLGEIFVDLLRGFEAQGVAKSRLVTFIHLKVRPDISGSAMLGPGESGAAVRKQLENMYQEFDKTIAAAFANLDQTELLP